MKHIPSSVPDKEDREILKGKSPSYIYGWNKVKHRPKEQGDSRPVARGRKRQSPAGQEVPE